MVNSLSTNGSPRDSKDVPRARREFLRQHRLVLAAALLLSGLAAFFGHAALCRPDVAFLASRAPADWILYPSVTNLCAISVVPLDTLFHRSFPLSRAPSYARLRVCAFGQFKIEINGQPLSLAGPRNWKVEAVCDVSHLLKAGANEVVTAVVNDRGHPALWLALETPEKLLVSDRSWEASYAGASWKPARLATDPRPTPRSFDPYGTGERPLREVWAVWPYWLLFAAASIGIVWVAVRWLAHAPQRSMAPLPAAALGTEPARTAGYPNYDWGPLRWPLLVGSSLLLTALIIHNSPHLRFGTGNDASEHLDYVVHVQKGQLPLPGDIWEGNQLPLYYLLNALVLNLGGAAAATPAGVLMIRLLNAALGVGNLFLTAACFRLLFPHQPRRQVLGLIVVAFFPALLAYLNWVNNDNLVLVVCTGVCYSVLRCLLSPRWRLANALLLGVTVGLALLTKLHTLFLLPPAALAILAGVITRRHREGLLRPLGLLALAAVVAVVLCGWYYARVYRAGLLVDLWTDANGFTRWWQDPSYRTFLGYLRFGGGLHAPFFVPDITASWDGLYRGAWGDAEYGGIIKACGRAPWSYNFMAANYILGLVPTVVILAALAFGSLKFLRQPAAVWGFLLGLVWLSAAAMLWVSLQSPRGAGFFFRYWLVAFFPLSALAALGLDWLAARGRWCQGGVLVFLGVWAMNAYASYWIVPDSLAARKAEIIDCRIQNRPVALGAMEESQHRWPDDAELRAWLADDYLQLGRLSETSPLLELHPGQPDWPRRHLLLSRLRALQKDPARSFTELEVAVKQAPDDEEALGLYGKELFQRGRLREAAAALREVLRINPRHLACHNTLAFLYSQLNEPELARRHRAYVEQIVQASKKHEGRYQKAAVSP